LLAGPGAAAPGIMGRDGVFRVRCRQLGFPFKKKEKKEQFPFPALRAAGEAA
jgi:hypothetical protein